jgi:hypothetical protein
LRYARFGLSRQNPRLAAYGIRKSDRDVFHNTGLVLHRPCVNPLFENLPRPACPARKRLPIRVNSSNSWLKNAPCVDDAHPLGAHRDAATAIARQRATPWRVNLCLARALLAAPSGPSAMCFLRHARGFGWLDPSLRRRSRRLLDTKAASPRKWDMRGRCPSRIHEPRGSAGL